MKVSTAAKILTNLSEWNGECDLVVEVDGKDCEVDHIDSEDYAPKGTVRHVRLILKPAE